MKRVILITLLLVGCGSVHYQPEEGVLIDTGSSMSSISYMPSDAEVIRYVNVVTADSVSTRPGVLHQMNYANCSVEMEVNVRKPNGLLADVLLGRDFIRYCGLNVYVGESL